MSPESRSLLMSRIRGKDTEPERLICEELKRRRHVHGKHAIHLPGRPDIVFDRTKVAVFIDGDFWHGWRFPLWKHKLSEKWQLKIAGNRKRDQQNFRKLRRLGWKVIRIWEHHVEADVHKCVNRIVSACQSRLTDITRKSRLTTRAVKNATSISRGRRQRSS